MNGDTSTDAGMGPSNPGDADDLPQRPGDARSAIQRAIDILTPLNRQETAQARQQLEEALAQLG